MSTEIIEVRGIQVAVTRKAVKNLHLAVYPPDGEVRATTPLHYDNDAIRLAVVSRIPWIQKQQKAFQQQDRQTPREMVSGETHYFKGSKYRLDVVETTGKQEVRLVGHKQIRMQVRPGISRERKLELLREWYRLHLKAAIAELRPKWEEKLGVRAQALGVKSMKTKWGSCNIEAKRIWINLELAKKSTRCLEYIMVHEFIHFFERHHTERFQALMDQYLPDWRMRKAELNSAPLAHEEWEY